MAPHWRVQASVWGEAGGLFNYLLLPASWLCQAHQGMAVVPAAFRLLTSSVATVAKAAHLTGISPDNLFVTFAGKLPAARKSSDTATIVTLLLPRIGAATAKLPEGPSTFLAAASALDVWVRLAEASDPEGRCRQPSSHARPAPVLRMLSSHHVSAQVHQLVAQMTGAAGHMSVASGDRLIVHLAVEELSTYAWMMVSEQWSHTAEAICDHHGAAGVMSSSQEELRDHISPQEALRDLPAGPSSQEELRGLLRRTVPLLLGSPLLDFLVGMQHVVVSARRSPQGSTPSFPAEGSPQGSAPSFPVEGSSIPPLHLMPALMDPDTSESTMAMQVGGSGQ